LSEPRGVCVKLSRHEDALADTDAALDLTPTNFKALRTRARINLHLENFDAAVGDFKSAIQQAEVEGCDADARALRSDLKKAEAALKRSKTKDYYKILGGFSLYFSPWIAVATSEFLPLGVARDCSELDIKKAYRSGNVRRLLMLIWMWTTRTAGTRARGWTSMMASRDNARPAISASRAFIFCTRCEHPRAGRLVPYE
jgi:DnaJ family protein C protein 7